VEGNGKGNRFNTEKGGARLEGTERGRRSWSLGEKNGAERDALADEESCRASGTWVVRGALCREKAVAEPPRRFSALARRMERGVILRCCAPLDDGQRRWRDVMKIAAEPEHEGVNGWGDLSTQLQILGWLFFSFCRGGVVRCWPGSRLGLDIRLRRGRGLRGGPWGLSGRGLWRRIILGCRRGRACLCRLP
jgi:hypothetical protein